MSTNTIVKIKRDIDLNVSRKRVLEKHKIKIGQYNFVRSVLMKKTDNLKEDCNKLKIDQRVTHHKRGDGTINCLYSDGYFSVKWDNEEIPSLCKNNFTVGIENSSKRTIFLID